MPLLGLRELIYMSMVDIHQNKFIENQDFNKLHILHLVFFLLWPFGALIYALIFINSKFSKPIAILFCAYFGLILIIPENIAGAADSARIADQLVQMHNTPLSLDSFVGLFFNKGGYADFYQPLMTWIVSIFTGNARVLFTLYGLVFGYFYISNLWIIAKKFSSDIIIPIIILFMLLAMLNPIWNINGVRMWTAAHIFIYGLLLLIIENKKYGFIWCVVSVLVHFSFFFPLLVFIGFYFFRFNWAIHLYFVLYILSLTLFEIKAVNFGDLSDYLPAIFKSRFDSYTNEAYLETLQESSALLGAHVKIFYLISTLTFNLIIGSFYFLRKHINDNKVIQLYMYGLLLLAFTYSLKGVGSIGRFSSIGNFITIAALLLALSDTIVFEKIKKFIWALSFVALYPIIFLIRVGTDYYGISLLFGNPLYAIFYADKIPIIEFVKSLI